MADQQLKSSLQNYTLPTPEQILTVGFKLQESALGILEPKYNQDCSNQIEEKLEKKSSELKNKCYICAIINSENEKNYQLIVGRIPKNEDQRIYSTLLSPTELSISYSGANDQPFHGALEPFHPIGDDLNGRTYGSNLNLSADYKWGSISFDAGTDLYVSAYNYNIDGIRNIYFTSDPSHKVLQEADEHTYLRIGTKYYLDDWHDKNIGEKFNTPYLKFGLGLEHDSDQGIAIGGISHREAWHNTLGIRSNQYVKHFKDQTTITTYAKAGLENYLPVGNLGFCSALEIGLSGNTTGNIKAEALIKAAIDSGTIGNGSRKNPLFIINFEAGISNPIKDGSGPTIELDPIYNSSGGGTGYSPLDGPSIYLNNKNYSLIGNVKNTHTLLGVEIGDEKLRLSLDVIYEKNQWSDGDLLYVATLKKKF